ncbi:MAG TPA: hypothetical protein VEA37_10170 [Flavobacterium sp.]|nr:hypothetical protein [Flavobacterium sp.]
MSIKNSIFELEHETVIDHLFDEVITQEGLNEMYKLLEVGSYRHLLNTYEGFTVSELLYVIAQKAFETVKFEGKRYPIREIELPDGQIVNVSVQELNEALMNDGGNYKSAEARYVDESIHYFVEPRELLLPEAELIALVADETNIEAKDSENEYIADAALIAAAPGLLKCAESVIAHFKTVSETQERVFEPWETELWQMCEDAVTKAKGGK